MMTCVYTYSGAVSANSDFLEQVKLGTGKNTIIVRGFTLQTSQNVEIQLNNETFVGTYYQGDNNYVINIPSPEEGFGVQISMIKFLSDATILRINVAYGGI